jgi:hypothetical protein
MWFRQETLLLWLAVLGCVLFFWRDTLRAREEAIRVSRSACESRGLQFLDDTVALARLGLGRGDSSWLALRRVYEFEFSSDGLRRHVGSVSVRGSHVESVFLPEDVGEA